MYGAEHTDNNLKEFRSLRRVQDITLLQLLVIPLGALVLLADTGINGYLAARHLYTGLTANRTYLENFTFYNYRESSISSRVEETLTFRKTVLTALLKTNVDKNFIMNFMFNVNEQDVNLRYKFAFYWIVSNLHETLCPNINTKNIAFERLCSGLNSTCSDLENKTLSYLRLDTSLRSEICSNFPYSKLMIDGLMYYTIKCNNESVYLPLYHRYLLKDVFIEKVSNNIFDKRLKTLTSWITDDIIHIYEDTSTNIAVWYKDGQDTELFLKIYEEFYWHTKYGVLTAAIMFGSMIAKLLQVRRCVTWHVSIV